MELRSSEALTQIQAHYGGVMNLCSKLKSNPVEGKGHMRSGELEEVARVKKYVFFQLLKRHLEP